MKRILSFLLMIAVLVCFCACNQNTNNENYLNFYYCSTEQTFGSENGIFAIEERLISCKPDEYRLILEEFLRGPRVNGCISPFPGGTVLEDFKLKDGYASIVLSPHMALQANANLIVCCACLCQTLFEFPEFETIEISIANNQINGESRLVFNKNSFSTEDNILVEP